MNIKEILHDFKKGQKAFGEDMAIIINSVLLTCAYFLGIGFTFLLAKLFNKKFLDLEIEKDRKTYWEDLNLNKLNIKNYYRQF